MCIIYELVMVKGRVTKCLQSVYESETKTV